MAEDKGGFRERWQYRQEMRAHGAWNRWGFPTREEYAQFHDARNMHDLAKTWLPNHVEAYGLGTQGLTPLLAEDKDRLHALLGKRIEEGLSAAEVQEYAQLYNRWQAEHTMLAGGAEAIAERIADLLEEAQRQGLVVTGTPVTPAEEQGMARVEPHRTTEDLGFVLGAPERRELTQSEAAAIEARTDVLRERETLVEERVGPLVSQQEGERWMQALREQMAALMPPSASPAVKQHKRMGY